MDSRSGEGPLTTPGARDRQDPPRDAAERRFAETLRRRWLGAAVLAVAVLLTANHRLVTGTASGRSDADSVFAPYYMLVADYARAGKLMLWNPLVSAGSPDGFEPQLGAFSPLTAGVGLMTGGHEWGFRLYWLTLWALGGLGMLLLARHLGAPAWGACIGAIAFMFSGPYTGHAQHTSWIESISFLPWIVWRLDAAMVRRRLVPAVQAAALWGLSALAGYPALTLITAGFGAAWVIGRAIVSGRAAGPEGSTAPAKRDGLQRARMAASSLAVFVVLGAVILSPTYVGFLVEARGYSDRAGPLPRERAVGSNALHPGAVATHASPHVAILKLRCGLWSYTDPSTCSVYVGPLVTALALLALIGRGRDGFRWWLAALGALALATAMGRALPLRGWLYDLVPPTRYFRHAGGFRIYWVFTLVVLSMMGVADLAARPRPGAAKAWRRLAIISAITALAALATVCALIRTCPHPGDHPKVALGHVLLVWGLLPALARAAWLNPGRLSMHVAPCLMVVLAGADAVMTTELSAPTMYLDREKAWAGVQQRHVSALDLTRRGLRRSLRAGYPGLPNNKNMVHKEPVLLGYAPISRNSHFERLAQHPILTDSALDASGSPGSERVWFSAGAPRARPTSRCFDALAQRCTALGAPVLVVADPADMIGNGPPQVAQPRERPAAEEIAGAPSSTRQPVSVWTYTPDELGFDADCPEDGWLLVTDRWSRSWRVTVNGQPRKVWGGNFVFRAVRVTRGANRVHFTFDPFGHPWLLVASWTVMGSVGGVWIGSAIAGVARRRAPQGS